MISVYKTDCNNLFSDYIDRLRIPSLVRPCGELS